MEGQKKHVQEDKRNQHQTELDWGGGGGGGCVCR
jgi:hypothetical protein